MGDPAEYKKKFALSEYQRGYYQKNKERSRANSLARYYNNRDQILAMKREEYRKGKENVREYRKQHKGVEEE